MRRVLEMSKEHSKMEVWAARLSAKIAQLRNELSKISTEELATLSGADLQGGHSRGTARIELPL